MPCKIRLHVGSIELEYEGPEDFPVKDLPDLVARMLETSKSVEFPDHEVKHPPARTPQGPITSGTTSAIAGRIKCKGGKDLVLAAAAKLHLVGGSATFTRSQLLTEMKTATAYYKSSYLNNLTSYIARLVRATKFNEIGKDTYSLGEAAATDLRTKIA
jgi:hypothetical protein